MRDDTAAAKHGEAMDTEQHIVNPYREQLERQKLPEAVYHPEAEGLNGEALDKLMQSRFTEGVGKGRQEAFIECQPKIVTAFDQGSLAGQQAGFAHGRSVVVRQLDGPLGETLSALEEIIKRSGSKRLKGLAKSAHGSLMGAIDQL
jgi:hypothetical protein